MNEAQLTKAVCDLLKACGWYVIRTHRPGQFATHTGVSDLIVIGPHIQLTRDAGSEIAFIELKGPRSKISAKQELFLADMTYRGHIAFIASDVETVIEKLNLPVKV